MCQKVMDIHKPPHRLGALLIEGWMRAPPASKKRAHWKCSQTTKQQRTMCLRLWRCTNRRIGWVLREQRAGCERRLRRKNSFGELQTTAANTCQHIISIDKEVSFPHNVSEVVGMHEPPQRLGASITEGWIRAPSTYWIERTFMAIARTIETASLGKLG